MRNRITDGILRFRNSLGILNVVPGRKKHIVRMVFCTAFLSCFLSGSIYAGTWREQFDDKDLNGWERIREDNPWNADWISIDSFLYSEVFNRKQEHLTKADFLHWNAHQFRLKRISVESEEINYLLRGRAISMSGQLCLFIGKRIPEPDFAEGYIISPEEISKMRFSEKGDFTKGESIAEYDLMWRLTRGNLKVAFNAGQFRLFTQHILVTEFFDPDITLIDVVGLLILCDSDADWFEGSISTFSVSGEGIPNHNFLDIQLRQEHLTTTWGALKR